MCARCATNARLRLTHGCPEACGVLRRRGRRGAADADADADGSGGAEEWQEEEPDDWSDGESDWIDQIVKVDLSSKAVVGSWKQEGAYNCEVGF